MADVSLLFVYYHVILIRWHDCTWSFTYTLDIELKETGPLLVETTDEIPKQFRHNNLLWILGCTCINIIIIKHYFCVSYRYIIFTSWCNSSSFIYWRTWIGNLLYMYIKGCGCHLPITHFKCFTYNYNAVFVTYYNELTKKWNTILFKSEILIVLQNLSILWDDLVHTDMPIHLHTTAQY